jgi:myo-inositol 2-dehydrogenase/D-chiro-inositol 1-dehydrogenase
MMNPLRFAILSFAHYHANFWAQAINETPAATLVGVWDDNPERGRQAAAAYGARYWPDLAALLAECDAVGITSETVKHAPLIEQAAAAGRHILCEKPMAASLADCDRIEAAVQTAGVVYMQNFPKRFDPINHELVGLVRRGELGHIALVRIRHANFHLLEMTDRQWFADPDLCGGGALLDEGIHAADFLLWLLGEPESVYAATTDRTLNLPVDDTAIAIFTYASGALAEITTGGTLLAAEHSVEVYGTAGSALLSGVDLASRDFSTPPYLKVFRRGGVRGEWQGSNVVPFFKQGNFHQQGPLHFIDCLHSGQTPAAGLVEGRQSLQLLLAAYRAAESGQVQPVRLR